MARTRVGIADVAAAAGVSISTVSVALNGVEGARISAETRERVRSTAESLGYTPNRLARGLRQRSSGIMGFLGENVATTPYAVRMILGAQEALRSAGRLMVLMDTGGDPALESREIMSLRQHQVDGILYASMFHRRVRLPDRLREVPVVLVDAETEDPAVSWVVPDEDAGARAAVGELVAHGHRRIGFVTNEDDIPATRLRLLGYEAAHAAAGIPADPTLVSAGPPSTEGGYRVARALLDRADRPTGLFCFSDVMAMGAFRAATDAGLRIPDDLSIVGYDNLREVAVGLFPGLTTVELPHYEMGAWAARRLIELTSPTPPPAAHARLRGRLIRRESVTTPPHG
jgi:LacI family transcriptional regulator